MFKWRGANGYQRSANVTPKKLIAISSLIMATCASSAFAAGQLAKLPKPNLQWKANPFIKLGVGYGAIGGANTAGNTELNALDKITIGMDFAQYRNFTFNTSLSLVDGADIAVYDSDGTRTVTEVEDGLALMFGTQAELGNKFYATGSIGAMLQRIESSSVDTTIQPAYQIGVGRHFTSKMSLELGYFGTLGSHISNTTQGTGNDQRNMTKGAARYNAGMLSVQYKF